MSEPSAANSPSALCERRSAGTLTWAGPAIMLFARSALALLAQGSLAGFYAVGGSSSPWRDAGAWLPLYGSLIDLGCLGLLWWLARREGIGLRDLIGFDRKRLRRHLLLAAVLIPPSLLFILGGNALAGQIVYGGAEVPQVFTPLPLLPSLYAVLVFPLLWGITEQMTYNGYLLPRFQALCGTGAAVALVAFSWSFQHVVMPLTFDGEFMLYRLLSPLAFSVFGCLVYLRIRTIVPLAIVHWLLDGAAAFMASLWPLLA